jgi:hypothetical protein
LICNTWVLVQQSFPPGFSAQLKAVRQLLAKDSKVEVYCFLWLRAAPVANRRAD